MKIQLLQYVLLLLLLGHCCTAQYDFSGTWEGELTQGEGGYAPVYKFKLHIEQDGLEYHRSYLSWKSGEIYAEWKLKGRLIGDKAIHWEEVELMRNWKYEHMEWCYKTADLVSYPQWGGSQTRRALARPYRKLRLHTGQDHRQEDFAHALNYLA